MRITDIKLRLISGSMPVESDFWEERLSRPLDVYPEHKAAPGLFGDIQPGEMSIYPIEAVFVQIETDDGVTGLGARSRQAWPISSTASCAGCSRAPTRSRVSACGI